jgi:hypothetical protein
MRNSRFSGFEIPICLTDDLFQSDYPHVNSKDKTCADYAKTHIVSRPPQAGPLVHFGIVASGNQVIKNAEEAEECRRSLIYPFQACLSLHVIILDCYFSPHLIDKQL